MVRAIHLSYNRLKCCTWGTIPEYNDARVILFHSVGGENNAMSLANCVKKLKPDNFLCKHTTTCSHIKISQLVPSLSTSFLHTACLKGYQ